MVLQKLLDSSDNVFETVENLRFRVSFYDQGLDRISAPIVFSQQAKLQIDSPELVNEAIEWSSSGSESLPTLHTARNDIQLIKQSRLIVLLWVSNTSNSELQ